MNQNDFSAFKQRMENNEIKIVFQMVVGRGGSLLLHSLLDNHPSILAYPGILNFHTDIWPAISSDPTNAEAVLAKKMGEWIAEMSPYNVGKNLGETFSDVIEIDCRKIAHETGKLLGSNFNDKKNLFIALQFSIADYFGISLNDKRVVYCHEHSSTYDVSLVQSILMAWPQALFLAILRDPRSNYIALLNWEKKRTELNIHTQERHRYIQNMYADMCYFWYTRLLEVASLHPDNFLLIRLEDLQKDKTQMLHKLCHELKIEFNDSLLQTTFLGKTWHGDNFSPKGSGIRNSADPKKWKTELSFLRKSIFEIVLKREIEILEYPFLYRKNFFGKLFTWLFFPIWFYKDWEHIFKKGYYTFMASEGFGKIRAFLFQVKTAILADRRLFHFIRKGPEFKSSKKLKFLS